MSLFVNPLQFGPAEDFDRYPRDLPRDRALASGRGVDLLFAPAPDEMYGRGQQLRITGSDAANRWEGAVRPGHFDGVLTVVAKLFNIVGPDVACFGQKDIQQVTLIRRMIGEFDFPVRMVVVPTVREPDGLAMSSRNVYLTAAERLSALSISQALRAADARWRAGESDPSGLAGTIANALNAGLTADYIAIVDPEQLAPVSRAAPGTVIALAVRVGKTRLVDNIILGDRHAQRAG
jgi:pantoate--beta-alanine ligase